MNIIQNIILGIVQGIGEFLPISSSAHLIFIRYLFNFPEVSIAVDVALHFGTLVAVLFVYWKDWITYIKAVFERAVHKKKSKENNIFWYLVLATIPGAIVGFFFEDIVNDLIRNNVVIIAITLALMGVFIYFGDKFADKFYFKQKKFEDLTLKQTFIIGMSQALAIIPGFSRSGTTILTARLLGVTKEASAKFTFLLSTPIIFGATIVKLKDITSYFNLGLLVGIVTSAIIGVLCIKFLLKYIKTRDFAVFAYYRFIVAIIVLVTFCIR